jgi:hypothetical protein
MSTGTGTGTGTEVTLSEAAATLLARRFLSMIFPRREKLRGTEERGGSRYNNGPERKGFRVWGVFDSLVSKYCFVL